MGSINNYKYSLRKLLLPVFAICILGGCLTIKLEEGTRHEPSSQTPVNYKIGKDVATATRETEEDNPSVSWDGTHYLVVWQDQRSGQFDIYASRVSPNGEVLDPEGLPISTAPLDQIKPKILWNGTYYLVVWQDKRNGKNWEIYGARVTPDGKVLDSNGFPISVGTGNRGTPVISWNGKTFFVVWEKENPGLFKWDIYGARITPEGKVLDPEGIPIVKAPEDQYFTGISWSGNNYMVVWSDKRSGTSFDIYGTRISQDGTIMDPKGIVISQAPGDQFFPSISWNGEVHLVTWMDKRMGDSGIYGARITAKGAVLDPDGIAIAATPTFHALPVVISKNKEFLVVWEEEQKITYNDIYAARLNSKGKILNPGEISIYTGNERQGHASAATDGNLYFVVWKDERTGIPYQGDIYGQFLDFSPAVSNLPSPTGNAAEQKLGPYIIHQISVNPQNSKILYAATSHYGILRSEDGGQNWALINQGLKSYTHHQVVVHPQHPEILYAGAWGGGMSKSTDAGNSWQEINTGLGDTAVNAIALDPKDPDRVYVATESGVFRSHTGGREWEPFNNGLARSYDESFLALLILQTDPDILYLGSTQGLYRWDGSPERWIHLKEEGAEGIKDFSYDPNHQLLFAVKAGGDLLKSQDKGKSWSPIARGSLGITNIVIDPVDPHTLYLSTTNRGVLKTVDSGQHWEERNTGFSDTNIQSLAIDPNDPRTLYAGTYEDGIFISHDGGKRWVRAQSIPQLTMTEILKSLPLDEDMRSPPEVKMLITSPELAKQVFSSGKPDQVPPPEFAKCNECHGWTDPLLNLRRTNWRVSPNIRDWEFTVRQRMSRRAELTPKEEEAIIQFLDHYSRSISSSIAPINPTASTLLPSFSR